MVSCDVCENLLLVDDSDFISDREEGIRLLCPYCNHDNTYQIINTYADVLDQEIEEFFLESDKVLDDEILIEAFAERFGMTKVELEEMIRNKEVLGWDMHIQKRPS